jgi:acyl-CoA synthetase (AMP-forming)/AMP-acid ligase II/acyl carrier protein
LFNLIFDPVTISSIYKLLENRACPSPDSDAILGLGRAPLTFGRLCAHVREVVACLNALGIHRHDKVAIVLPNGPEMAVGFLSIACGAVAAPLNPFYGASEFEFYLSDLDARALVVQAGVASPAIDLARGRGIPVMEIVPKWEDAAGLFGFAGVTPQPGSPPDIAEAEDIALVLHTSGTTSRPKMVPLSHRNLCASADHIREGLALTPSDRCLNIMPLFHIHGLVAAVLSSLGAGGSVVATPGFDAPRFFDWLADFQPTWYTAVPTMHRAILARSAHNPLPFDRGRLRFIRSCSSALPPTLMAELETWFGVPVLEAYGMTEASHQMTSNPLPPRARKSGSVGVATGTRTAIMEAGGARLLAQGEVGEIVVRGPNVMHGYAHQVAEQAFTDGWFRTGDVGRLDADGYLFIEGRIKEIINRGGEKISPREVEEALLQHPAVAQAVVFALPDKLLGQDVGAAVVLREASVTEKQLRQFVAARLVHFKVPSRILVVNAIPVGPTGKPQRIGLAEKLGLTEQTPPAPAPPVESAAPRTPEEEFLRETWCEVLRVPTVGIHQRFLDVGGDSLLAARIVARVSQQLDVDVTLLDFLDAPTIAEQALMLADKMR